MEIPSYILLLLGCLGAADIALFHSVAHGIRSHRDSVRELITHSLRGPTYAALFVLIPNFEAHGLCAWGLVALFALDVGISIWDFSLEQDSRRYLGGLPSGEYVLHMLMAMVFGALVTSYLWQAKPCFSGEPRLLYAPTGVPAALRFTLLVMAILVFVSGIQDATAACRLGRIGLPLQVPAREHRKPVPEPRHPARPTETSDGEFTKRLRWMRVVLGAAGIYNLLWGSWVVLFPAALFEWVGMTPINYPEIWQCVGMIVGVYGVGYLIAARDPVRFWPIVLVGLLGKVLGPAGMFLSISRGSLPDRMGWMCVANDLIWWGPFGVILVRVFGPPGLRQEIAVRR